jgi:uncharacterized protein YicC (UPF0701 family)
MLKSMTGFGKATKEFEDKIVNVEIRSLNSKGLDLSLRLSSQYRDKEHELKSELIKLLERGKVDLSVYVESKITETPVEINMTLAKAYHVQLKALAKELNEGASDLADIYSVIMQAITSLNMFRDDEGKSIEKDFVERITNISNCLEQIKIHDTARIQTIKDRIQKNLEEVVGVEKVDKNRFEQELIYYIEKLDINEEKVRLKTHLDYFLKTMQEPAGGRKLNFIGQEIGREINTIGSKANDAEMQKSVVLMKDELEKIKEQTNNVL